MKISEKAEECRWDGETGGGGAFVMKCGNARLRIIACNPGGYRGWEHVSVSLATRCPTWDEMCFVRRHFFFPEETVVQFHPPESDRINEHPYCLHLWRSVEVQIQLPPKELV